VSITSRFTVYRHRPLGDRPRFKSTVINVDSTLG
jgi:hypothetical protein